MKKYLVTGGAGFIASHLVDQLILGGDEVIIIDDLSTGKEENINKKAKFYKLDICDFEKIKPLFKGVDGVFHLAAIPSVPQSVADPIGTSRVNVMGAINVFKASVEHDIKRVVFASSSAVYGNQKTLPFKENMQPNPVSPYGLQKLVGEQFAKVFCDLYNIQIVCMRYFNVYGPRVDVNSDYSLVLGKFLKLHQEGKPLTIYGDGKQTRGFCYVLDVVNANIRAMESNKVKGFEILNISGKGSSSIKDLAKLIGGEVVYLPKRKGDPLHTKADINRAKKIIGWQPNVDFKEGVVLTKEWFKNISL
ncbi:MAG: NAD-dependent epimerase/dehydratase family protein [Candidatus Staskawiczbacteria bacterium]|nr:NAD-dependent epimerase/dehydratase family protein [Candidatus Staskawiczbacteria bacterium]